jgi:hypothetical protein
MQLVFGVSSETRHGAGVVSAMTLPKGSLESDKWGISLITCTLLLPVQRDGRHRRKPIPVS